MTVCISAWVLCFFLYLGALFFVDNDIKSLRAQLATRAAQKKAEKIGITLSRGTATPCPYD